MTAKPFDPTLKDLVEAYPADWLAQLGLAAGSGVDLINADLSTVTVQADRVLRVRDHPPWLVHIELQTSWDDTLLRRILKYNVLLHDRHELPVLSVLVLLRPEADRPQFTGGYEYRSPSGPGVVSIGYQVVRVWQCDSEQFLAGGLGTLPLAPVSKVSADELPRVVERMKERIGRETTQAEAAQLWMSTYMLMGLRYPSEFNAQLLRGVRDMKESTTYQAILAEGEAKGEAKEARRVLVKFGTRRFGSPPDAQTRAAIEAITDLGRLERMMDLLEDVDSWQALVAMP